MLKKLTRFYYPKTIEEACLHLGNREQATALIAGGTSEVLRSDNKIEALVDLSKVKELCYIRQDSAYIHIGAATPVSVVNLGFTYAIDPRASVIMMVTGLFSTALERERSLASLSSLSRMSITMPVARSLPSLTSRPLMICTGMTVPSLCLWYLVCTTFSPTSRTLSRVLSVRRCCV